MEYRRAVICRWLKRGLWLSVRSFQIKSPMLLKISRPERTRNKCGDESSYR